MKGSRKSVKMSNDKMMICCVVVVLILVGLYFLVTQNNLLEGFESQPAELNNLTEKPNPSSNEVVVVFFYADWCPHCVSTKPEWANVVQEMNNTTVNNKNVKVNSCNCEGSEVEKATANDNNIQGYPTIKCIKNGETVDYNGARDSASICAWVRENCA